MSVFAPPPTAVAALGDLDACLGRVAYARGFAHEFRTGRPAVQVELLRPLLDAADLFESLGLPYALVGGVAAMYYGRPRITEDVDFVAVAGHRDALAAHPGAMRAHRFDPGCTWKLYHASGIEIDLWKDEHSDGIAARAADGEIGGRRLKVADPHDLIAMKLRAGRFKDDYDISEMLLLTKVDDGVVKGLVTGGQFEHFAAIRARLARQTAG